MTKHFMQNGNFQNVPRGTLKGGDNFDCCKCKLLSTNGRSYA